MARFAVIKRTDDGEDEIIDIKSMINDKAPELHDDGQSVAEEIGDGPKIGMVRGGPVGNADGFGFREGDERGAELVAQQETEQGKRDEREAAREVERRRASREPSAVQAAQAEHDRKAAEERKSKVKAKTKA
jgi:hypothetical protein